MFNLLIICCLLFTTNVNSWDGYHRQIDDELPAISWKECGLGIRKCDLNSTFNKYPFVSSRIWGGQYANTGEYPWFVFLDKTFMDLVGKRIRRVKTSCGGAVINEWWVLTAAHCVEHINLDQSVVVLVGSVDKFGGRRHLIEQIIIHPKYLSDILLSSKYMRRERLKKELFEWELNDYPITDGFIINKLHEYNNLYNEIYDSVMADNYFDIALLKVKNRIIPVFNETHYKINSICLPKSQIINERNENLVSIGMGLLGDPSNSSLKGVSSNKLKEGILIMKGHCEKSLSHENATQIFCTDSNEELKNSTLYVAGICLGDSGSPQHQQYGCQAVEIGLSSLLAIGTQYCSPRAWMARVSVNMQWIRSEILNHRNVENEKKMEFTPIYSIESSVSGIVSENVRKTHHLLIVSVITTAIIAVVVCSALFWICAIISMTRIKIN